MTAAGRIEREFEEFKSEVLARLDALEGKKPTEKKVEQSKAEAPKTETKPKTDTKKDKKTEIVLEAKGDEVVGTEVESK